jgi:hypothetical protein
MPQIGQAQSGLLKSIPKLTRINGDDNLKVIYRNMGNNHAYPFVWADTITVASGVSTVTIASGVKFHGYDLATYASVNVTPSYNAGALYITKDTVANTIICTTANAGPGDLDVMFMLGMDPEIEGIYCRGNTGAMPNYP